MTSCHCKVLTHAHHEGHPCENLGTESDGLCRACHRLTKRQSPVSVLDAFADLRRTWDTLIELQPDMVAASGPLSEADLTRLDRYLMAHQKAATALAQTVKACRKGGA